MIGIAVWQQLLNGIGWLLAHIYALIPNYGLTIIAFTLLIRIVLLPLGVKQIRSMQHMQAIQPKIKQLQQRYKGNRAKQQEEIMKLYQEFGVSPFSGCWPVLLQFPILIAMYAVIRFPQHPIHIPADTKLYGVVTSQVPPTYPPPKEAAPPNGTDFLGMNLLCSASQAGNPNAELGDRRVVNGETVTVPYPVDCGTGVASRIPYYVFAILMFGTTFLQQRQMQKASPPGAASGQQQAILKVMPLMFGVFGFFFPAGLVLYWTTSNGWQIGQQYFMLKSRPTAESLAERAKESPKPARRGFLASMSQRAEEERKRRQGGGRPGGSRGRPSGSAPRGGTSGRKPTGNRPGDGSPGDANEDGSGGTGGGSRKKRPKR
jgi:YidC/Oxa1 family membrane protein insertase